MPGDREDEICQKALQLLADLCSVGAVENENCRDFIYYLRDRARPRLTDSGPNVPVVLLPAVKLEPAAGSRHTSGKPRTLTAGGPCVHIAEPWSLASALAPPGGKRLQAHPPAVCLTQLNKSA